MTCLPPHSPNAAPVTPPLASAPSTSADPAHPQQMLGYAALAAARSRACSRLARHPHSRKRQGEVSAYLHLMLAIEVGQ